MPSFDLIPHPTSPCAFIDAVHVSLERQGMSEWGCVYTVSGAIEHLAIPPVQTAERADELWRHTCFELFLRGTRTSDYDEFNFSPSGQWAAYRFDRYRQGMRPLDLAAPPAIVREQDGGRFRLQAIVLLPRRGEASLQLALSTVLRDRDDRVYYWALRHPPDKADFHHDIGFAATLATA